MGRFLKRLGLFQASSSNAATWLPRSDTKLTVGIRRSYMGGPHTLAGPVKEGSNGLELGVTLVDAPAPKISPVASAQGVVR